MCTLARDARLLDVLHSIYGEPASLFKDKLIFKPPGARGYGIHQDWISWPGFPRSFLTVLIALDEASPGNGCTQVFAGIHRRGCLVEEDGEFHEFSPEDMGAAPRVDLALKPGDIAIFGGFTPHRSDPNRSDRDRRQLFLSYNALSDGGDSAPGITRTSIDAGGNACSRVPPMNTTSAELRSHFDAAGGFQSAFRYLWVHVVVAALAMVATMPGRTHGLGLITKPLLGELGISQSHYAAINLCATLLGAIFCVPCGWLLDRFGPRTY